MTCSYLASHPSGLIPIPFGLPASRPVRLLSFSFFRFSVFFGKYFYWDLLLFNYLSNFDSSQSHSFGKTAKAFLQFYKRFYK